MAAVFERAHYTKSGERRVSWRVTFTVSGKKKFRQFKSKRAAQRFANTLGSTIQEMEKEVEAASTLTIADLAESWLKACEIGRDGNVPLERRTVQCYRGYVYNYMLPALGDKPLEKITRDDVKAFRDELLTRGLARATCKKMVLAIGAMFGHGVDIGVVKEDPTTRVRVHLDRRQKTEVTIPTKDEARRILAASRSVLTRRGEPVCTAALTVLVYAGLRLGELRGLRWCDLDEANRTIHVRQRAEQDGSIGPPKSAAGTRLIVVPQIVFDVLKEVPRRGELVFATKTGRPVPGENIRKRWWLPVQREAKLTTTLTLHSLRHFFASRQIEAGASLKELCAVMGHDDPAFTLKVYAKLFKDQETEAKLRTRAEALVL